jgi:hypothetical protein
LLVCACATTGPEREGDLRAWIVGQWLLMEPDLQFPQSCRTDLPIDYRADGTYQMLGESGVWRLEGDRLREGATAAEEPAMSRVGTTVVNRIERLGRDRMRKRFEDGGTAILRRCPAIE